MKYTHFSTAELEKIGFIPYENSKIWYLRISSDYVITYEQITDRLYLHNESDDEIPNLILKIYNPNELVRRLPLLIDFALLVE